MGLQIPRDKRPPWPPRKARPTTGGTHPRAAKAPGTAHPRKATPNRPTHGRPRNRPIPTRGSTPPASTKCHRGLSLSARPRRGSTSPRGVTERNVKCTGFSFSYSDLSFFGLPKRSSTVRQNNASIFLFFNGLPTNITLSLSSKRNV